MSFIKQIASAAALGMALLLGSGLLASPAQAGFVLTLEQQGNDVVATGSGPIDLTDLIAAGTGSNSSVILPQLGIISIGPTSSVAFYDGVIGPTSFGSVPSQPLPDSVSGNFVGIFGIGGRLGVPLGYLSGDPLSGHLDMG
jgi:hypothetical protein